MPPSKRTVLITGCSDGSLGAALAIAFHEAGLHVYATARNPAKMAHLASLGIETLTLDVLVDSSIAACVSKLPSLDILLNNAGANYLAPMSDMSIQEAKKLFDLNVWSYISMTQACLPMLLKSKGMIVNQTSISSVTVLPFMGAYQASKSAISQFSETQRLELEVFGITVVELKTGVVQSNMVTHSREAKPSLPENSIYAPAKEIVEKSLRQEHFADVGMPAQKWAQEVVRDLSKNKPPPVIWRGEQALLARIGSVLPHGMLDGTAKKMTGMDLVEQVIRK